MKELKQKVAEIKVTYKPSNTLYNPKIQTSLDAYMEFRPFYEEGSIGLQEEFLIMYLNNGNHVLGIYKLSKGGITGTVADIRLIMATGLKAIASALILCHNHPSGNLAPSNADKDLTMKIKQAATMLDLRLLDHLIIAPGVQRFYSFADEGEL